MPNKYGLGRGLSSLFTVYEEPKKKPVKESKTEEVKEKAVQKQTKSAETQALKDIPEIVERNSYLDEKKSLEEKLSKIERNLDTKQEDDFDKDKIIEMPLTKIEPNVNQPRKNFDKDALMELADSIRQHGVIQPIIIQKKGDKYIIVAGERRYKAAKMAGLKTIPTIIKGYTTKEMKEVALIENVQREDLNPVETAFALKHLIDDYGLEQEDVAEKIGKTRSVVTNYLRILRLEPEVLAMVEKGKLTFAHAKALVSVTDRETQLKLAKKSSDGKISSRELEKIVQELINPEKVKKQKQSVGLEIKNLVGQMQHVFGTKVSVIGTDKRGRIYIDYFNQDDLDRIAALMEKFS